MRLLLAEDNELNVELFVEALRGDGHEVMVERDGEAACARALREDFDVVLLDVQMPGPNGLEVCRRLRAAGRTGPIVALTAAAMAADQERATDAGFDAYWTKPISPARLRAAVRSLAGRAPA